jgi:hypothetical protein
MTDGLDRSSQRVPRPASERAGVAIHPSDLIGPLSASFPQSPYFAHCDGCGAEGPPADTEGEAVDAWNAAGYRSAAFAERPVSRAAIRRIAELLCSARRGSHLDQSFGAKREAYPCDTCIADATRVCAEIAPSGATVRPGTVTPIERADAARQVEECVSNGAMDCILTLLGDAAIRGLAADWNEGRDERVRG